MKRLHTIITAFCLLVSLPTFAGWQLDGKNSRLNFISIKNESKAELHHFTALTGNIAKNGTAKLVIDLASVETNIPIRNERMLEHVFETNRFTNATVSTKLPSDLMNKVKKQGSQLVTLDFELNLHGIKKMFSANVRVTHNKHSLLVSSVTPVIVKADDYKLSSGITILKNLAKLNSIATAVPVTFDLAFTPN